MTSSEKIKLIIDIAKKLSLEEWRVIDLTLRQFKFPISESYSGKAFEYVIHNIENADTTSLLDLASHLKVGTQSQIAEIKSLAWKDGYLKLFISHITLDKSIARILKQKLEDYFISGFVAHSDIQPTKEWEYEIELALRTCDSIVALMSPGFHESKWTDQEIGHALGRDLNVIPVHMGLDPYGFIGKYQAITFQHIDILPAQILDSLLKNKKTSLKMGYALMEKFERSISFANAKSNISLLEKMASWDQNLIDRLKKAKDNNSQISESFGVPSRISGLLNKWQNEN